MGKVKAAKAVPPKSIRIGADHAAARARRHDQAE
jgi:hypothetical protein